MPSRESALGRARRIPEGPTRERRRGSRVRPERGESSPDLLRPSRTYLAAIRIPGTRHPDFPRVPAGRCRCRSLRRAVGTTPWMTYDPLRVCLRSLYQIWVVYRKRVGKARYDDSRLVPYLGHEVAWIR